MTRCSLHEILCVSLLALLPLSQAVPMTTGVVLKRSTRLFEDDFLKEGSSCTRGGAFDYPKCEPGTWCVGNANLRCVKRQQPGQSCRGEYEECATGSSCNVIGFCELADTAMSHYIAENATCTENELPRCFPGYWCIESKCRRLQPCGKPCDESFQICRPGLVCKTVQTTQKKLCTRDFGVSNKAQETENCEGSDPPCDTGLRCSPQDDGTKICIRPVRLGRTCIPGRNMCESGRVCATFKDTKDPFCADQRSKGERCDDGTSVCKSGLICSRGEDVLICQ